MPRPETGKFAIALRVSGPYSSLIGCSSGVVGRSLLHRRARPRARLGAALSSARDPARRSDRGGARRGSGHADARVRARTGRCRARNACRARRGAPAGGAARRHRRRAQAAGVPLLSVVIGSESVYATTACARSRSGRRPGRGAARSRAPRAPRALVCPIATSGLVGGGTRADVEAMEGYGVLRAAAGRGRARSGGARRLERGRGAGSWPLDVRRSARARCTPSLPGLVEEVARVLELTLRLLAVPERYVRVPRGRPRAARDRPPCAAVAPGHRGAEPRGPHRRARADARSASAPCAGLGDRYRPLRARRRPRAWRRAARRRARGRVARRTRAAGRIAVPGLDTTAFLLLGRPRPRSARSSSSATTGSSMRSRAARSTPA